MKNIETLVEDIYQVIDDGFEPTIEAVEDLVEIVAHSVVRQFSPKYREERNTLRMSNIGKPICQLWHEVNGSPKEKLDAHVRIKFLFGDIIEALIIYLAKEAGHKVTDEQKEVKVDGITGHMDCKIDGVTIDVKSTTKFGIKDFQNGTLAMNDGFGYVDQVKAYAHAEGETKFGWLAMCKQNGTLAVLTYDLKDKNNPMYKHYSGDIEERVKHVKKLVELPDRPSRCSSHIETFYGQQEDGKSGNLKLSTGCSYCKYKKHCYPEVRGWYTSGGPKFLTTVINIPKNKHGVPQQEINLNIGEVDYG